MLHAACACASDPTLPPPQIYSRNLEDNTTKYPDIIARIPGSLKPGVEELVLDCEAVGWDRTKKQILPFQILSTRGRKDVSIENVQVSAERTFLHPFLPELFFHEKNNENIGAFLFSSVLRLHCPPPRSKCVSSPSTASTSTANRSSESPSRPAARPCTRPSRKRYASPRQRKAPSSYCSSCSLIVLFFVQAAA